MRIWLEKFEDHGTISYYIFTKEPEWLDDVGVGDWGWRGPGWYRPAAEFDAHVTPIDRGIVEKILLRAEDLDVGTLTEIELVNIGVWSDTSGDNYDEEGGFTLLPGRMVAENFYEE